MSRLECERPEPVSGSCQNEGLVMNPASEAWTELRRHIAIVESMLPALAGQEGRARQREASHHVLAASDAFAAAVSAIRAQADHASTRQRRRERAEADGTAAAKAERRAEREAATKARREAEEARRAERAAAIAERRAAREAEKARRKAEREDEARAEKWLERLALGSSSASAVVRHIIARKPICYGQAFSEYGYPNLMYLIRKMEADGHRFEAKKAGNGTRGRNITQYTLAS